MDLIIVMYKRFCIFKGILIKTNNNLHLIVVQITHRIYSRTVLFLTFLSLMTINGVIVVSVLQVFFSFSILADQSSIIIVKRTKMLTADREHFPY